MNESFAITSSLVQIGSNTGYIRDTVIERVKNFCPGAAGSGNLISVIDTENLIIQLDELAEFIVSGTTDLRSTLQRIIPVIDDILFNVQKWTDLGFIPLFPMLPYVIFSSLFIVGVTMAWLDFSHSSFERFQTWFVLPIFCITTALYWVLLCIIFCVAMLASGESFFHRYAFHSTASYIGIYSNKLLIRIFYAMNKICAWEVMK